jgi:hypothetical protein
MCQVAEKSVDGQRGGVPSKSSAEQIRLPGFVAREICFSFVPPAQAWTGA